MSKVRISFKHHIHIYFIFCLIWLIAKQYYESSSWLLYWDRMNSHGNRWKLHFEILYSMPSFSSFFFDVSHVTSSSTNQSSSKFWLDVTHFASSDDNFYASFFSTLFRPSASSFHHNSNRNTNARLQVWVEALIIFFRSSTNPIFYMKDLRNWRK